MAIPALSKTISRWLLAVGGLVLALVLAEVTLRMLPPLGPEFILAGTTETIDNRVFKDDVALRVVLAPNVDIDGFTTNSLGIRSETMSTKRAGARRILAIGDSFTLGMQVADGETFSDLLSEKLGPEIQVFNAGVPGYGTEQATELMRRLVPEVEADAVLLTVYTGNDFRDNRNWVQAPGMPTEPPPVQAPPSRPPRWTVGIAKYSRIASNILMFSALKNQESDFRLEEYKDEILPFADMDHLNQLKPPTRTAMKRFLSTCFEVQVKCGVAIIPPAFVVHPERVERTFTAFGLDPAKAQLDAPQKAMRRIVPKEVAVIDLTEALQLMVANQPYLTFDPHFSAAGHAIAAEALAPFITELVSEP
jgi:lysophospholipase L1-like esterase